MRIRDFVLWCTPALKYLVYLAPPILVPFELYGIFHTGPLIYNNNFPALIVALCLFFASFQLLLLEKEAITYPTIRWKGWVTKVYWAVIAITSTAGAICYIIARKYDCFGLSVLTLLACCLAIPQLRKLSKEFKEEQARLKASSSARALTEMAARNDSRIDLLAPVQKFLKPRLTVSPMLAVDSKPKMNTTTDDATDIPWWKSDTKAWKAIAAASRPVRLLHVVIAVMNTAGAITLAHLSHINGPGYRVSINVPGLGKTSVKYYCTTSSTRKPRNTRTVWFEGSSMQGITDFLGVQHYLLDKNIASCSYDPPSFGGSDAMPAKATSSKDYLPALINTLDRLPMFAESGKNRTYVGWGSAGTKLAVQHALVDKHASIVVSLDPVPDGAEYFIDQVRHGWSTTERLHHRLSDLASKVEYFRLVLSIGIGWGFLPAFKSISPPPLNFYYPPSGLATWRSQKLQERALARQYYELSAKRNRDTEDRYLNTTHLPDSMVVGSILSTQLNDDLLTQNQWRLQKSSVLDSLGGNQMSPIQCWDCSLNFPIEKSEWTAGAIAKLVGA